MGANVRELAAIDAAQVVEAAVGGVLLAAALSVAAWQVLRWLRTRRVDRDDPGVPALARFVDSETTDPRTFGGGAWSARVVRRRDTVTYGYLAVAEEYASEDSGGRWCTLTVTLPGRVPFLVADNRVAIGRTGVPMAAPHPGTVDDPPFDATYVVGSEEAELPARVLTPEAREVLLRAPLQRLMLRESHLLLRTFDGVGLEDETISWLDGVAARFLGATPSFVRSARTPAGGLPELGSAPLPEGRYGPG